MRQKFDSFSASLPIINLYLEFTGYALVDIQKPALSP